MTLNLENGNKVLFNKLNEYFNNNISLSLKTPNKIFIITKSDLFYEINVYDANFSSIALSDNDSIFKSMEVKQLSGKNINGLSYGFCHYIAWNDKREIFCWGNNECGQLGNGKRDEGEVSVDFLDDIKYTSEDFNLSRFYEKRQNEPELNVSLSSLKIDVIKCGFWHSLALTKNGEVFSWGLIATGGNIEEICQLKPIKVDGFGGEKVVMISCGYKHSMALTERGRVFSWGANSYGQLGHKNVIWAENPKLIELNNVFFKKISCGKCHSLLLSNDGVIYAFGDGRFGQIGDGSKNMIMTPVKLNHENKFNDIASSFIENISVSLSLEGNFYFWGKCREEIYFSPFQTDCKSFNEVFSLFDCIQYEPTNKLLDFEDLFFRYDYYRSKYEEKEEIGKGSFGRVLRVVDKNSNYFAIKIVKPIVGYEEDFRREYINHSLVNQLGSEFFIKQFDFWFENNENDGLILYIKMELCDKTLNEVMDEIHSKFYKKENELLSPIGYYLASDIFIKILNGVHCLHRLKIIHRDLKPSNIMLKKEENGEISVKIADFGLSVLHKFAEQSHSEQSHTLDKGTHRYMAPEVSSSKKYNTKADIYSLGIIFENLFKIETTSDYNTGSEQDIKLLDKYIQALEIYSRMTDNVPKNRPNCEEILEKRHLWAINEDDFDIQTEKKLALNSRLEDKSFIYSIIESKFIAINVKTIYRRISSIETLFHPENGPDFIQRNLAHLKIHEITDSKIRTEVIDSIFDLMSKNLNSVEIQQNALNAMASLYYFIETKSVELLNPNQVDKLIKATLTAMESYPNRQQLQKNALFILYSNQILENLNIDRFKCTELVMNSLVNFKKTDMNLMASVICTTHLMRLSIRERSDLGSKQIYIKTLLEIIKSRIPFFSYYYLIENTLSALVNLLVDSWNNCSIFSNLGGLDVSLNLLETFVENEDIELRILGLLYNLAEFPRLKRHLLKQDFLQILRKYLISSSKINLSFLAAGIFAQLFYVGIEFEFNQFKIVLGEMTNVISNWENQDKVCVSFVSFSTFHPLLSSSVSSAVHYWAIWTIHHFCSANPGKYCDLIMKEIGFRTLKTFRNTSSFKRCVSLSEKTLEILKNEYNGTTFLKSLNISNSRRKSI